VLIVLSFTSAYNWGKELLLNDSSGDINSVFYNEFFSVLILADVLILLLSFQYTERYSQIVRNTGFIISTVLIRLSFGVTGLANISLVVSSVVFGLIILWVYNLTEKERRGRINII
jgi:NADH:ubiquinone oxidoreductase subunit 4 (subunit M)